MEERRLSDRAAGAAAGGLTLLPGVLVVGFAFASGGYQPDAVALVAGALTVMLALGVALIGWPLSTLSAGYVAGAGALALLAGWTYVSERGLPRRPAPRSSTTERCCSCSRSSRAAPSATAPSDFDGCCEVLPRRRSSCVSVA